MRFPCHQIERPMRYWNAKGTMLSFLKSGMPPTSPWLELTETGVCELICCDKIPETAWLLHHTPSKHNVAEEKNGRHFTGYICDYLFSHKKIKTTSNNSFFALI